MTECVLDSYPTPTRQQSFTLKLRVKFWLNWTLLIKTQKKVEKHIYKDSVSYYKDERTDRPNLEEIRY